MLNYAPSDTLTLSHITLDSVGTATLSSVYWQANDDNIRTGFIIVGTGGVGKAVLTSTPGDMDYVVNVKITEAFTSSVIASGNWTLNAPDTIDVTRYLPPNVQETELLPDYFTSLSDLDYGFREANDAIDRVGYLRRWDRADPSYLSLNAELLGFFYLTGVLSTVQKRRLLQLLPYFYQVSGTTKTIAFLSFFTGISFVAVPLWTTDYLTFFEYDGTGYPTNHIQLRYDPLVTSLDVAQVTGLFYDISPVEWVLDSIVAITSLTQEIDVGITFVEYNITSFSQV